jgi:Domain of unknown function (DUF5658)
MISVQVRRNHPGLEPCPLPVDSVKLGRCGATYGLSRQNLPTPYGGKRQRWCLLTRSVTCFIATVPPMPLDQDPQPSDVGYSLVPEMQVAKLKKDLGIQALMRSEQTARASRVHGNIWSRLIRVSFRESSLLEWESLGLIVLSLADLLVTYSLLRRGPAFYESNPVAQWFFARWNIAGMALFQLGTMGFDDPRPTPNPALGHQPTRARANGPCCESHRLQSRRRPDRP